MSRWMIPSRLSGIDAFTVRGAMTIPLMIFMTISGTSSPPNARLPVAISESTVPRENRSVRASTGCPCACSGDMYEAVPTVLPVLVRSGGRPPSTVGDDASMARVCGSSAASFASPKSRTFSRSPWVRKRLAGLMSR